AGEFKHITSSSELWNVLLPFQTVLARVECPLCLDLGTIKAWVPERCTPVLLSFATAHWVHWGPLLWPPDSQARGCS
ncbi:hypothetical protein P7K49_034036, partial [Saguinus oedipus]